MGNRRLFGLKNMLGEGIFPNRTSGRYCPFTEAIYYYPPKKIIGEKCTP